MKINFFAISAIIFLILILFCACSAQKDPGQRNIEETHGAKVIRNSLKPLYPDMKIIFEEDLTIGVEDGDEHYMFGNLVSVNTDEEGNFYVADKDRNTVKKYDSNGRFLLSFGGSGQGPGEFQDMSEVRFDVDGNIYLNDTRIQRISFLKKDGYYLRGIKTPSVFEKVVINSKGYCIAMSADNVELGENKKWDYFYGLFDNEFNLMAEFLRLPQEATAQYKNADSLTQVLADALSREAFAPNVTYVLDKNDSIYFGYPETYEIEVYSPEGKLKRIIQRDFKPVEVSERHRQYFIENLSVQFLAKIPVNQEKKVFELIRYPEFKPAYERFTLMENGWILVVVDSVQDGSKLVDIFDKDGEFLTQFETDISTDGLSFNNGYAYAVATKNDYKFIKRYDLIILGKRDN